MAGIHHFNVSMNVYGADLIPEHVTSLLGVEPTKSFRRGDRKSQNGPDVWRHGAWLLDVKGQRPENPEDGVAKLMAMLSDDEAVW